MSRFLSKPRISPTGQTDSAGEPLYQLRSALIFEFGPPDSGDIIEVPAGRITNLATVPRSRFLRWLYRDIHDRSGRFIAAPILHDFLCNERFPGNPVVCSGYTRYEAAAVFRMALEALNAPRWQSLTAYWAVRLNDLWREARCVQ